MQQSDHSTLPHDQPGSPAELSHRACVARCSAATLYLMSQYAQAPSLRLACAIADQLRWISLQPAGSTDAALRQLALGLLPRWQALAAGRGHTH